MVLASPQHATSHSVSYLGSPQKAEIQNQLDQQLVFKQDEVAKGKLTYQLTPCIITHHFVIYYCNTPVIPTFLSVTI